MAEESTTASTTTETQPTETSAEGSTSSTTGTILTAEPTAEETAAAEAAKAATGAEPTAEEIAAAEAAKVEADKAKPEPTAEELAKAELFGAPDGSYELDGLPEGTVVDAKALEAIEPIAKELGLSNKGLSKIAGVYAEKVLPGVVEQFTEGLTRDVAAQRAEWDTETRELIKTDPVFKNSPLSEVQQVAAKAIDRFGGEDFRKYLEETGLGNNPAMVKFAFQAGSAISEDTTFERGGAAPKPKSRTEKYYGPQPSAS